MRYAVRGERVSKGDVVTDHVIIGTPGTVMDWALRFRVFDISQIRVRPAFALIQQCLALCETYFTISWCYLPQSRNIEVLEKSSKFLKSLCKNLQKT